MKWGLIFLTYIVPLNKLWSLHLKKTACFFAEHFINPLDRLFFCFIICGTGAIACIFFAILCEHFGFSEEFLFDCGTISSSFEMQELESRIQNCCNIVNIFRHCEIVIFLQLLLNFLLSYFQSWIFNCDCTNLFNACCICWQYHTYWHIMRFCQGCQEC